MNTERRCAIYIRTAAAADTQSIDARIEECRATAEAQGLSVAEGDIFVDNGVSGLNQHGRPAWNRLLHAALNTGEIGTIITRDPARISRDVVVCAEVLRRLGDADVRVLFANSLRAGEDAKLPATGRHRSNPPFGFLVTVVDPAQDGAPAAQGYGQFPLVVDESILPSLQLIFKRIEEGTALGAVANELTVAGATPPGARWTAAVVRRIATNPIYAGRLVFRMRGGEYRTEAIIPAPPVDPERFDRLQALLKRRRRARPV
jgi:hypothetical protein